jgi:hypothetical protein
LQLVKGLFKRRIIVFTTYTMIRILLSLIWFLTTREFDRKTTKEFLNRNFQELFETISKNHRIQDVFMSLEFPNFSRQWEPRISSMHFSYATFIATRETGPDWWHIGTTKL